MNVSYKNKNLVKYLILFVSAVLLQSCGFEVEPEDPCNFVQNSKLQRVSWKGKPAKMYIHNSVPSEYHKSIKDAAEVWNLEVGYEVISIESVVTGSGTPKQDGYNVIYWMSTWDENKKSEQARTTIYWKGSHIYEADIRINAKHHRFSNAEEPLQTRVDFNSLMVHEMGHVLGLAHIPQGTQSVMQAYLSNGVERRNLFKVDENTLSCEYGG